MRAERGGGGTLRLLPVLLGACGVVALPGERPALARYRDCADAEARGLLEAALVHLQAEREEEAVPLLAEVVRRCPDLVRAHLLYQDASLRAGGDHAAAMRSWYAALPEELPSPVAPYVKARLLDSPFLKKEALDRILAVDASFPYAHFSLGRLMRANGKLASAADSFRRTLALDPDFLQAHLELAETLVEQGRDAEAAVHYASYLGAAPHDLATARAYVHLLVYRLRRPDEALRWCGRLLERNPGDDQALMDKAAALWQAARAHEALDLYLDVLQRRPDLARAVLNVGYLYYDALPGEDRELRRLYWPKAALAFQLYLRMVRPEEAMDHLEVHLAVPYRLQQIERELPAPPGALQAPTLADLQPPARPPRD